MRFEEFQPEIDWWGKENEGFVTREENQYAWKVSIEDIKTRNYNLDIKNPHVGEKVNHDPDLLFQRYNIEQESILDLRNQLKSILEGSPK